MFCLYFVLSIVVHLYFFVLCALSCVICIFEYSHTDDEDKILRAKQSTTKVAECGCVGLCV